jgi:hypothetical protein
MMADAEQEPHHHLQDEPSHEEEKEEKEEKAGEPKAAAEEKYRYEMPQWQWSHHWQRRERRLFLALCARALDRCEDVDGTPPSRTPPPNFLIYYCEFYPYKYDFFCFMKKYINKTKNQLFNWRVSVQVADVKRLERGWRFIVENLDQHAEIEEKLFFPALRKVIEDDEGRALIDHLLSDHQDLGTFKPLSIGSHSADAIERCECREQAAQHQEGEARAARGRRTHRGRSPGIHRRRYARAPSRPS